MGGVTSAIEYIFSGPTPQRGNYHASDYQTSASLYNSRSSTSANAQTQINRNNSDLQNRFGSTHSTTSSYATRASYNATPQRTSYNGTPQRTSYNVAPQRTSHNVTPRRTVTSDISNRFYTYVMQQCIYECSWLPFSDELKVVAITNQFEYNKIKNSFSKYLRREKPNVIKIEAVQNHILMGQYLLKKAEYQYKNIHFEEKEYYHGTKEANVYSICCDNFDWRRTNRNKFGKGVSFAPKSSYAINYCDRKKINKVMFVAKVLVGKSCLGTENMPLPRKGYDATIKEDGNVLVKYYDNEFYPAYIIHFTADFIPYHKNQQSIRLAYY